MTRCYHPVAVGVEDHEGYEITTWLGCTLPYGHDGPHWRPEQGDQL